MIGSDDIDGGEPVGHYDPARDAHVSAWFMGPKAEHSETWEHTLGYVFGDYVHWRRNYFPNDPVIVPRHRRRDHERWQDLLSGELDVLLNALKADFPFYHPRYLSHMLSEQTLPSVLGWFAGMLYNPNNVTDDAAPVTVELELEVGRMVAEMIGYRRDRAWAHLTSGGTIANIEAMWVARIVQFTPFALREMCKTHGHDFEIKLPSGRRRPLRRLTDDALLRLAPNEAIFMPRQLQRFLMDRGSDAARAGRLIKEALRDSQWNVGRRGFAEIRALLGKRPVVFAPASAHYSVAKACNLMGYGEDALRTVPVDGRFRMDVDALRKAILAINDDEYVAVVVAVVGTTEEGAVDPVHQIKFLRDELSGRPVNGIEQPHPQETSFWLHVDAAWGGYIASLFRGHAIDRKARPSDGSGDRLGELALKYAEAIDAVEDIYVPMRRKGQDVRKSRVWWNNKDVYAAFLAMHHADSVAVDPHKLGYVPYPAGVVAFRNGVVTELLTQKANYISEEGAGLSLDEPAAIEAVGPFILEGSKPGAAAASCWLAHKTIPLDVSGHGRIIRETLMAAGRLARYLDYHRHLYFELEADYGSPEGATPFSFTRLFEPDTNVVCFVAHPKALREGKLIDIDCGLERLNAINVSIHEQLGRPSELGGERLPYLHPFFVSRTKLEHEQYSSNSIAPLLRRIGIAEKDYRAHGLFVLRSAVMNPHYATAVEEADKDYLRDFLAALHRVARQVIG